MTEHTPMKEETGSLLHAPVIIQEATPARRATRERAALPHLGKLLAAGGRR